ncbi:hypothetical protein ACFVT5_41420 [Streptomyces sp. NPDC058001]|uniref:hypothetical protein n=1 Tax=Streptomyces sp. NPDC058001 TaxID=3346300 RepID=UPI0036E4B030
MRTRTTVSAAVLMLAAALTACGSSADTNTADKPATSKTPKAEETFDCMAEEVSQADWTKYCSGEGAGTGGDGTVGAEVLKFGKSYTWPDGLKVTVVEAKRFTDYDADLYESAEPGKTDFRLNLKIENTGKASVDLGDLSTIIEGATDGGEAASTAFENGASPLEGRLAPGRTVTKTDDNVLETRYGKKIVVTVQRISDALDLEFPEFEGEIR